jgi:hypothetical protein
LATWGDTEEISRNPMNHRLRTVFSIVLFLCAASLLSAQTASISGTVQDASGSGVPDAKVTVKNVGTAAVRTAATDTAGVYSVPNLPVGQYDLSVEKTGFQTLQFQNVTLTVSQNLTLNGALQIGAVSQAVEVQGDAVPAIDLEDAQISNLVDQKRIVDLPLITRDPNSLVLLSSGTEKTNGLGGFSVNGQRDRSNNFLLDGVDNNDASVPGIPGGVASINPDSTQEFRVITNNFMPEYGRNTGALVDVVTKGGTNSFHGDAYEFHRDRAMAARDYFNTTGTEQNPFVFNDFGASLGGPIRKDKTFFFVNADWTRIRQSLPNEANNVPTAAFRSGVFDLVNPDTGATEHINLASPSSPNNLLGLPINPTMQKALSLFPTPNVPSDPSDPYGAIRGVYDFSTSTPSNSATTTFRLDHQFNEKFNFSGRYNYTGFETSDSTDELVPGIGGVAQSSQVHSIKVALTATLRPDLVNEFRAGVNRSELPFTCVGASKLDALSTPDAFGVGSDYDFGSYSSGAALTNLGCTALTDSNGQARRAGTWNVRDNLSVVKGNHNLKFGVEYFYVFERGYDAFNTRPLVDFTAFGNDGVPVIGNCSDFCQNDDILQTLGAILLGVPGQQTQSQYYNAAGTRTANDLRSFVQHEYGAFVQDSWKIRPNLTLNFGLRYAYYGVPFEKSGNLSNLLYQNPGTAGDKTFQIVGPGTGNQLYYSDALNFEPRAGLAWDPFKDGKTSVRLGYGIFHDRIFGNLFTNLKSNPPFVNNIDNFPNVGSSAGSVVTLDTLGTPATSPAPSATVPEGSYFLTPDLIDRQLKMPYTQAWNAGVQRQFFWGMTLDVNYVASTTHRLFRSVDGNQPLPSLLAAAHANGTLDPSVQGGILRLLPLYDENFDPCGSDPGVPCLPQVTGNTVFQEPIVNKSIGNATYNSLQVGVNRQFKNGIQFQVNYTWAHAIDDAADPIVPAENNRAIARNSFNLHEERGDSDFDLRHRIVGNFIAELPFGPGHAFMNHGLAGKVLGGWEFAGITQWQTGLPYTVYSTRDSEWTGLSNRPDLVGSTSIPADAPRNQFGPPRSAIGIQPFGRPGNLGRNVFVGPRFIDTDASLLKTFRLTEKTGLQFRAEVFNLFNHVLFDQPDNVLTSGTFGQSLITLKNADGTTSARQIQLALKLNF